MRRLLGPTPDQVRNIDRELLIGRAQADVELTDQEVSRRHAVIRPVPAGVEVEDLDSSNGTYIDGYRIQGTVTLTRDTKLRVGETDLTIEIDVPQATRISPARTPQPADATVQRPTARPQEAVVARPQPDPPPPVVPPPPPQPDPGGGPQNRKRLLPFAIGGVAVAALIAVGLILVLGGSSKNTASTATAPHCAAHFPTVINDGFPEPPMRFSHNGVLDTTLRAAPGKLTVDHHTYTTMEYEGSIPGPTLVICPGDRVTVNFQNQLHMPSNLHVHGLHVSPQGNGDNVFVRVNPSQHHAYQYQIPLDQSPGAFWYHPHFHPYVQPELLAGMAGAIVVQGGLDDRLANIPQRLIVIQGGNLQLGGAPIGRPAGGGRAVPSPPPLVLSKLLVNGVNDPIARIRPGQIQRWRIFNANANRLLRLAMPGTTFQVLAQDGTTLRFMRPERDLLIGPGSRLEVLVRGGAPGRSTLSALPFHQCIKRCNPLSPKPNTGLTTPLEPLLTVVSSGPAAHDQLPRGPIGNPPDLRGRPVDVHRTIVLADVPHTGQLSDFVLNDKLFNPSRVDITMKLGSVEQWTLKNPAGGAQYEWHTFHVHQNPFQVVSVNGHPRSYIDWEDNVTLAPGETVVIRMHPIDFTGTFVFHCHVVFHEDHGMMGVVQVLANPTASQVNADRIVYLSPHADHELFASVGSPATRHGFLYYCRHLLSGLAGSASSVRLGPNAASPSPRRQQSASTAST